MDPNAHTDFVAGEHLHQHPYAHIAYANPSKDDGQPSHEDVWLGINRKQANMVEQTMTKFAEMDTEHDDSNILIFGKEGHDFVLVLTRDSGNISVKDSYWQCMRRTYSEALVTAVRKIDTLKPAEKMYLVHSCGKSFDDMQAAAGHDCDDDAIENEWRLLPESEAM